MSWGRWVECGECGGGVGEVHSELGKVGSVWGVYGGGDCRVSWGSLDMRLHTAVVLLSAFRFELTARTEEKSSACFIP